MGGDLLPPDWSQFVPDLVNALITGAVLAFVFWRLQLWRDGRAAKQDARDDWNRLTVWLRPHFRAEELELIPSMLGISRPDWELREAVKDYPIEEWARLLPKDEAIAALVTLEREWPRLTDAQTHLRGVLPSAVRATTPPTFPHLQHLEGNIGGLVPVRIQGDPLDEQVGFQVLRESLLAPTVIEEWLDRVIERPEVAATADELRTRFDATQTAYRTVRAAVGF